MNERMKDAVTEPVTPIYP